MNFTKIAVHRPVTTFMGLLIVSIFGLLSLMNINLDMMPNVDVPIITVITNYDGASAYEMETLVTEPLEGALGTVPNVKSLTSTSRNGLSYVTLEFVDGTNIDMASLDVRDKVALVESFLPENASEPIITKFDFSAETSSILMDITSDTLELPELQVITDNNIIPRLKIIPGVADATAEGGFQKEIVVTLKQDKLRGYGISEMTIQQLLRSENLTLPAGTIKQGDKDMTIRIDGLFEKIEDIENLPITTPNGQVIYLRDVANVTEGYGEATELSYTNGRPSLFLTITKQSTANSVDVSRSLNKELDKILADNPNIIMNTFVDPAEYIELSISDVVDSAILGVILATIVLFIFLKDIKVTLVVAIAMPLSIVATFILMYYTGITINMLSLGGLMLGVGMLVDNSIVVIESIFRKLEEGENSIDAALNGSREVSLSIITSTLTTIVVFFPITFAGGVTADMLGELTYTISFAIISSLVIALSFVPMMSALLFKNGPSKSDNILSKAFDKVYNRVFNYYGKVLAFSLKRRGITYIITTAFVFLTLLSLRYVGTTFIPSMDMGVISINASLPVGTQTDTAIDISSQIVENIEHIEEIDLLHSYIYPNGVSITLLLVDMDLRDRSTNEISWEIEGLLKDIPGANITTSSMEGAAGGMSGGSVSLEIYGSDLNTLEEISKDIVEIASSIEGTGTATSSLDVTTDQANIKINRDKASTYGLNSSAITSIISTAIEGTTATTFKADGNEYDIVVKQDSTNIEYINDLQNILIPSPYGVSVPLYELADIELTKNPATIRRTNQQRYISVSLPITESDMGTVQNTLSTLLNDYPMPEGYIWSYSGNSQEMQDTFSKLILALIAAVLLVYMVMAANFESLVYPLIVMFSIPIAITGAFFGLFIADEMISINSFIGLIMLSGIVINNAIVLIDYTNLLVREQGMEVYDALLLSGKTRLRPILMSTLTTALGLIPIATSTGPGSEMLKGLAVAVIYGLLFSTVVTLVLIPTVYLTVNNIKNKKKGKKLIKAQLKQKKALAKELKQS